MIKSSRLGQALCQGVGTLAQEGNQLLFIEKGLYCKDPFGARLGTERTSASERPSARDPVDFPFFYLVFDNNPFTLTAQERPTRPNHVHSCLTAPFNPPFLFSSCLAFLYHFSPPFVYLHLPRACI
jgi:hypothetical protein